MHEHGKVCLNILCNYIHTAFINKGAYSFGILCWIIQVAAAGGVPRAEVIKMVCRSIGDASRTLVNEYLEGIGDDAGGYEIGRAHV